MRRSEGEAAHQASFTPFHSLLILCFFSPKHLSASGGVFLCRKTAALCVFVNKSLYNHGVRHRARKCAAIQIPAAVPLIYHQQLFSKCSSTSFSACSVQISPKETEEDAVKPNSTCLTDLVGCVFKLSKTLHASVLFVSRWVPLIPQMVVASPLAPNIHPMTLSAVMGRTYETV